MRLQVVLYVAVFLCVASFAAGACTSQGIQVAANGQCVCQSGYSGADCSTPPVTTGLNACAASPAGATTADHFPTLDLLTASYDHNTLRISVNGDYVTGRQYKAIRFVNETLDSCSLGTAGSFWSTEVASCLDKFHLNMPWVNHTQCGFKINAHVEDSTNDLANEDNETAIAADHFVSYAAKFTLYYTESLGSIENITLFRNTSVPYQVFIRFPTRLDVSLTNVNVTSIVEMGIALTQDNFDPETQQLSMEITIINSWPNMIEPDGTNWAMVTPTEVGHIVWGDGLNTNNGVTYMGADTCTDDEGSVCVQSYQFTFNTTSCTFDGTYTFTTPLYTCRGSEYYYCTNDKFTLAFDLETSTICSNITVTPPLAGNLKPYHNMDQTAYGLGSVTPFSNPADSGFNIGSYGYFQIELINTQGNTIALEFYEISFQANGLGNKNYLMKNGQVMDSNTTVAGGNANSDDAFHYDEAKLQIYNPAKGFQVYFSSVVFKVLPTKFTVYTFRASAYATFSGNEGETKRAVDFVWEADVNQLSTWSQVNLAPADASSYIRGGATANDTTSLAYILAGAAAGLLLIILSVIGLAVYHKKQTASRLLENSI